MKFVHGLVVSQLPIWDVDFYKIISALYPLQLVPMINGKDSIRQLNPAVETPLVRFCLSIYIYICIRYIYIYIYTHIYTTIPHDH
jgi:hypothetical protein